MTVRTSPSTARTTLLAVCTLFVIVALAACAGPRRRHMEHHLGFESDARTIQVVTTLIGGKNVFIPSTIVVTSGAPHTLSIFNTTDIPHGFRIPALGVEVVLAAGEETLVELPALEEGQRILQINCHLHPPHRTATLVVLPGRR